MALMRRLLRRHAVLDVVHHRLDHDDRVVHDDADRQHEAEQREHVDREAEQREEDERADQRDRHGQQRDQRGAPVLQEHEDHEDDQHHRLEQRVDDLVDALRRPAASCRARFSSPCRAGSAASGSSIVVLIWSATSRAFVPGIWKTAMTAGGPAVVAADRRCTACVPSSRRATSFRQHLRAVGVAADDDVAELLLVEQAALRLHRVGVLGARRRGRPADLAGGGELVLLVDRVDDVGDRDARASRCGRAGARRAWRSRCRRTG